MEHKCYLCNSEANKVIHNGVRDNKKIDVLKCSKCGLVFLSTSEHISNAFYEDSGIVNYQVDYDSYFKEGIEDAERRFNFLRTKLVNKKVLDFGCGAGNFLFLAKEIAAQIDGYELDKFMCDNIKQNFPINHGSIYQSPADIQQLSSKYDIITLFHVLEHFANPIEELSKIKDLLKPDGEIIIEVPNSEDALFTLYNCDTFADFTYWSCHLFLYNIETIKMLMDKAQLKINFIKQIQRYPLSNHLYWLSQNKPGGHKYWNFIDNVILNNCYESALVGLGKADTIIMGVSR